MCFWGLDGGVLKLIVERPDLALVSEYSDRDLSLVSGAEDLPIVGDAPTNARVTRVSDVIIISPTPDLSSIDAAKDDWRQPTPIDLGKGVQLVACQFMTQISS